VSHTSPDDVIQVGQIEIRFRLTAEQTGGHVTMFEARIPAGARVPVPHSHEAFDETAYGLAGVTTITLNGQKLPLGPGDVVFIPCGVVHQVENLADLEARALNVVTPGLLGPAYFRKMSDALRAPGPPDVGKLKAIMQRHGLRPAGGLLSSPRTS
jgi:quercetin dioxygenase-like cupin family protein